MNNRIWLVIALIVGLLVAGAAYVYFNMENVTITVETNGTDVTIKSSAIFFMPPPPEMIDEMKDQALVDVQDETSTADSFKQNIKDIATRYNYTANVKLVSQFGENQLPMPATVKGTSMVPTLQDGQDIIVLKTDNFQVNDLVVAVHPEYGLIVKRIAEIKDDQVFLKSDNREIEIVGTETRVNNGVVEVVTIEKTPLDAWLPKDAVIGVVKIY